MSYLKSAFGEQLEAAIGANAEPNTSVPGDSGVRQAFHTLLSPEEQRAFFQRLVADQRYWPRLKSLIGVPPYSFLMPEDDVLLRAGGICKNRAHLSPQRSNVSKAADFGDGHFQDAAERTYRVISHEDRDVTLPWQNLSAHKRLVIDVRLKRFSQKTKVSILRGTHDSIDNKAALMFPRPNEEVVLHLSRHLETEGPRSVTIRVESGRQKVPSSPIARLLVTVVKS